MKIELTQTLASNGAAQDYDVRQLKKALNRLGYYTPYEKVGMTGIPDRRMFDALKSFQRMNNLRASGEIRPNDETARVLNLLLEGTPPGLYIWRTVEDGKVRSAHAQYNRTIRSWSDSLDPGEDFNCRCWAEFFDIGTLNDAPVQSVYPEEFLIPLMGVSRLYTTWKLWQTAKNTTWTLGRFKSQTRWGNQLKNRDWTPEQITKTIAKGKQYRAPNNVNKGNKATRYEYDGRYVVQDEVTKEILQISKYDFKRPEVPKR